MLQILTVVIISFMICCLLFWHCPWPFSESNHAPQTFQCDVLSITAQCYHRLFSVFPSSFTPSSALKCQTLSEVSINLVNTISPDTPNLVCPFKVCHACHDNVNICLSPWVANSMEVKPRTILFRTL